VASRAQPLPAIDHGAPWQVVVVVRGRVVCDACEPAFRALLVQPGRAFAAVVESPTQVDGWIVHARARDGVVALIAARPGEHEAVVPEYLDALVDAYAPARPAPAIPPDHRGGGGGSGAPGLIAAFTPQRPAN